MLVYQAGYVERAGSGWNPEIQLRKFFIRREFFWSLFQAI